MGCQESGLRVVDGFVEMWGVRWERDETVCGCCEGRGRCAYCVAILNAMGPPKGSAKSDEEG